MTPFESTLLHGEPELMRVSSFRRYLAETNRRAPDADASTRLSSLNPSLMADLLRFEHGGRGADVLEVLAACVRHGRALTIHLQCTDKVLPLTVFPREQLVHCPVDPQTIMAAQPAELPVLQVETALLRPPGDHQALPADERHLYRPLAPLLWTFAVRGVRSELLPEVAGTAVYRVSPAFDVRQVAEGRVRNVLQDMSRTVMSLREIAERTGLGLDVAARLINALYLQSGLIISRSHPGALSISG